MPDTSVLPHLIALTIGAWVVYYSWKRSATPGIKLFLWYSIGYVLWMSAFIFELTSPTLEIKLFWDTFQWIVVMVAVPALPVFALLYRNRDLKGHEKNIKITITLSAILTVLIVVDSLFKPKFFETNILNSTHTVDQNASLFYVLAFYCYVIFAWGIRILLKDTFSKNKGPHHKQTLALALGFLLPVLGSIFDILGFRPFFGHSIIPISVALGNVINAWNLAQYNIFLISPASRDDAFEAMMDPVVILDNNDTVIDINRSMLDLLGKQASNVIGESAKDVFDNFPIPIKLYTSVSHARTETEFNLSGKIVHYEMSVWPILNQNYDVVSRLYISHDITALKELEMELRRLNDRLEVRVKERTQELAKSYDYTLEGWARALELRDKETEGHSRRVMKSTLKVAHALGLPKDELEHIRRGAILHDIGKMAIPDQILLKPGKLTPEERKVMETHPTIAYQLLERIPYLARAMDIPYCHHERWDGTGYPRGLKKYQIPIAARIFAVADVWDALCSDRPYSRGWTREEAINYLMEQAGSHFDPRIVNIFLDLVDKGQIQ